METAFCRLDVVSVRGDIFLVAVCVLNCYFCFSVIFADFKVDDVFVNQVLCSVEILNVLFDSAFIVKDIFILVTIILDADLDALVQEGHLTESSGQRIIIVNDVIENCRVRPEGSL